MKGEAQCDAGVMRNRAERPLLRLPGVTRRAEPSSPISSSPPWKRSTALSSPLYSRSIVPAAQHLPLPVWAQAMMSRPLSAMGSACFWMGVGLW